MKRLMLLLFPAPWRKKKLHDHVQNLGHISSARGTGTNLAASLFLAAYHSATVCDIADFPDPAGPFSQQIRASLLSTDRLIFSITSLRVSFRHLATLPRRVCSASWTGASSL